VVKKMQLMREAAGRSARRALPERLAVSFDPEWNYSLPAAFDPRHSKRFVNAQGVGGAPACTSATATAARSMPRALDRNYLALAGQARRCAMHP
jgi:hypothetical protein